MKKYILALCLVCMPLNAQSAVLRIATLSPGGSFWVESFKEAARDVKERTQGRVSFKFFPGGIMGSEQVVLRKMRVGQLQGGAISTGALHQIYPALSLYSVPFMFTSQEHVHFVRASLDKELIDGAEKKGYVVPAFIGGGFSYIMSKDRVLSFEDLKSKKIWVPDTDPQSAEALTSMGLKPIPLSLGDVLTGLETGLIDTVAVPPVVAVALQWHSRVKHVLKIPVMPVHGVVALSKRSFDKLSQEDQKIVREVFARTAKKLEKRNLADNIGALEAMQAQGIEIIQPQGAALQSWEAIKSEARLQALETSPIPMALLQKVQQIADAYKPAKE